MRIYSKALIILTISLISNVFAASFQGIGLPPDGISYASGVSSNYIVVGDGGRDNWIWTNGAYSTGPGPIADISDDGSVFVANIRSGGGSGFYKVVNGVVQSVLGYAQGFNNVTAVSTNGSKIIGYTQLTHPDGVAAWVYQNGNYTTLTGGIPTAISSDGLIIAGNTYNLTNAVLWKNGSIEILSNPADSTYSRSFEISGDGSAIVGFYAYANDYACLWRNGGVETLPMLAGATSSIATAVSFDGSLVFGNSFDASWNDNGAFVWDEINGTRLLKDFLQNDYGLNLNGWNLLSVSATDASGNIITGYGINPAGQGELWIATIPEPTSVLLLGFGGLLSRRRSKN